MNFSRSYAERRTFPQTYARHIFLGEEFSRAARLWTNSYVLYSASRPVIAVRYEGDKANGFSDWVTDDKEAEAVEERLRTVLRAPHSNQSVGSRATSEEDW